MKKSLIEEKVLQWKSQFDKKTQSDLNHTPNSFISC